MQQTSKIWYLILEIDKERTKPMLGLKCSVQFLGNSGYSWRSWYKVFWEACDICIESNEKGGGKRTEN